MALLAPIAACGGATLGSGTEHDSGVGTGSGTGTGQGSGPGTGPGSGPGTCNIVQIVPPILSVVDAVTGAPICDAALVNGDGGTVTLSPCGGSEGCTGTCQYTVNQGSFGTPFTVTVTAPEYVSAVSPELTTNTCGCEGACAGPDEAVVKLTRYFSPPAMPSCPTSAPTSGGPCSTVGSITCEYGTNPNPDCNQQFQCVSGAWQLSDVVCASVPTCSSTEPAAGSTCTTAQTCAYASATCLCTSDPGGLPSAGGPVWDCIPITPGCPGTRPDLGTPCSASSTLDCDYGQCVGGVGLSCQDGLWQLADVACPV